MSNLIRGEFYKIRKSKYFVGMMFLSVIVGFFLTDMWSRDREMNVMFAHYPIDVLHSIEYAFNFIVLSSFFFALLAGEFIAQDFKTHKLSNIFSYGYSRNKIILSKFIVFIICSLFLEIIYLTIFVIYVSSRHGFCEVLNLSTVLYLTRVISLGVMYNLATISIITMIAIITKNNFCTFVSPIILLMTFSLALSSYPYISHALLYLPYMTGIRAINIFSSEAEIIRCIISSAITFVITIGGSLLYVKHEDIR